MPSQVSLTAESNKPYVPMSHYEEEPLYALLTIDPTAAPSTGLGAGVRSRLSLVLVVDASGTMYNFQLSSDEREYWLSLALSRNEMERGSADERDAVYWSGQTLQEMQSIVRRPMTLAVDAIKQLLDRLETGDSVSVVAFADHSYTLFTESDWQSRPEFCRSALEDLLDQRFPFDIGNGTRLAAALQQASQRMTDVASDTATNRIILLSDGIVQDRRETFGEIEKMRDQSFAISTIGVGDEFDEEFLMKVADSSRGEYYYAADIHEITDKLLAELSVMQSSGMHEVFIGAEGRMGAMVQDVYMVSPNMTIFDEMEGGGGTIRARVGDLPSDKPTLLLLQIAPALLGEGQRALADVTLNWNEVDSSGAHLSEQSQSIELTQGFSDNPALLAERNDHVQQFVDRFKVYKYEREAQRHQERGNIEAAREKLGAATRELQKLGETELAGELEQQIASLGTGFTDPSRIKRIKATTRKLGEKIAPG